MMSVVIRRRRRPFGLASQDVAGATWSGYRCRHVTRIPLAPCGHGLLNIGETAVDSLCGKLATYVTSTTPR